jgi:hypothetical protein
VKNTERLLGIALAVLALEGCRGSQQQARGAAPHPSSSASPAATAFGSGYHGAHVGGYAAGAAAGALAGSRNRDSGTTRVLGRGAATTGASSAGGWHGFGGGFGHSGGFGGG